MSEEMDRLRREAHTKWLMFMNADPDDTGCPQTPTAVYYEAFEDGFNARDRLDLERPEVVAMREALLKSVMVDNGTGEYRYSDFVQLRDQALAAYDAVVKLG